MIITALYRTKVQLTAVFVRAPTFLLCFSATQFRWKGQQPEGTYWSLHSLFIGECPHYCHDRGLCTITGCQCTIDYTGIKIK